MALIVTCQHNLEQLQTPDGAWGYDASGPSQVEPTCLALLALGLDASSNQQALAKGLAWLRQCQNGDGAWRISHADDTAVWPTALAIFAQRIVGNAPPADVEAGINWLLQFRGQLLLLDDLASYRRDFEIDPTLCGWPWVRGTSSWVEPTAWSCLALRHLGFDDHPRVEEGLKLLLDRAMEDGGINAGNRRVFGRATQPVPAVTALLLLAFAGRPDHPRLQAARDYLLRVFPDNEDLETLCWIRLALAVWPLDERVGAAREALTMRIMDAYERRQTACLFRPSPVREALTALALAADQANPFRWPSPALSGSARLSASKPIAVSPSFGTRVRRRFQEATAHVMHMLRPPALDTTVHIAAVPSYEAELASVVREQYTAFREKTPLRGKRVVLKPNMVEYHRDKVINTDPRVVAAVIELCRAEGAAEVLVAEGPGHWRNTEYLVTASGLGDVLRHYQVPFVDLNHDDLTKLPNMGRLTKLENLYFAQTIASAEVVISIPKLKTHHWATVTLGLKNMFGTLPGICYGWPKNVLHWRGIDNSIVDIALTRAPDLVIVDGIIGMEGDGPLNGTPKPMGLLIMGCDPLAVDATCCRIMQIDPAEVGHLALAARKKVGQIDAAHIQQLGETIAARSQPFTTITPSGTLHVNTRQAEFAGAE